MHDPVEEEEEEPIEDTVPVVREEERSPQRKDNMSTINEKLAALKPGWSPKGE